MAKEEAKKAGYWSGAAAISVTILYEVWKIVGFPGGREWIEFCNMKRSMVLSCGCLQYCLVYYTKMLKTLGRRNK